ncbi:MAG: alpha amylase C-terminal domain-containing protein, partial [Planctomycetaceae bacterium]|nr:alpha amylase C-terminal domain-containing protein [Planctomycetaceae bacterium]
FGCTVLSAGVPMFLFGEEVGFKNDFLYNHILALREDFRTLRRITGQHLFTFYSDLIHLRRDNPGLRADGIDVLHVHDANRVLAWHRWGDGQDFLILSSLNNRAFHDGYVIASPRLPGGRWKEIFNSDAARYGGDDVGNYGAEIPSQGGALNAVIPANGFIVLKRG